MYILCTYTLQVSSTVLDMLRCLKFDNMFTSSKDYARNIRMYEWLM